jgi:hypothetical protein
MAVNIPTGFIVTNIDPVDARLIVENETERLSFFASNVYEGMVVYQKDTNELYVLFDTAQRTSNAGWNKISSGSVGGTDTQIQFNSGSVLSGSTNLTYDYTNSILSGTTTKFTTISGSTISSSNFVGNGSSLANLTASNITNFTNDVRAQFTPGTNITIVGGVISSTGGGGGTPGGADTQVQFNSGSTFSGSSNLTYNYTTNTLSGTTAQFTTLSASYISSSILTFDTGLAADPTFKTGQLFYSPDTLDLSFHTSITDIKLNIGQQTFVRVKNQTGAQIDKGKLVFISGGVGDNPLINTASWDTDTTSARTIGMVLKDVPDNDFTYVILNGVITGVDTAGYTAGQTLFLSSSGDYTNITPTPPNHTVRIGEVVRQHATVGSIFINIQNGYELTELHDVSASAATNGDLLVYDSATSLWKNTKALSGSYTITNDLNVAGTSSLAYFDVSGTYIYNDVTPVSSLAYTNKSASIASQDIQPRSVFFNPNGTKMYVIGDAGNDINQYTLSTSWDVSTATFFGSSNFFTAATWLGLYITPNGQYVFINNNTDKKIYRYTLTNPWQITSLNLASSITSSIFSGLSSIGFKPDGLRAYVSNAANNEIYQCNLTTAWDIQSTSLTIAHTASTSISDSPQGINISLDGRKIYTCTSGETIDLFADYNLTTPWELNTIQKIGTYSIDAQMTGSNGLYVSPNTQYIYGIDSAPDVIFQYEKTPIIQDINGDLNINGNLNLRGSAISDFYIDGVLYSSAGAVLGGGAGQNVTVSTSLQVTGPTPTFNNPITASGGITGSTAQFTTITGSTITSSNFVGNGRNITNITASNIDNFTNDVRSRFSAGTGIVISAGVISASNVPNSSLQNSSLAIGTTSISLGATGSIIQGLTTLTSSVITSSNFVGNGSNITNITASNITNFTNDVRSRFSAGTGIVISAAGVISASNVPNASLTNSSITIGSTSIALGATASSIAGIDTVDTTNLEVTNLKASDGTSAGSIANTTGIVSITSLTASSVDINSGTIDATAIGSTTRSTGQFTNVKVNGEAGLAGDVYIGDPSAGKSATIVFDTPINYLRGSVYKNSGTPFWFIGQSGSSNDLKILNTNPAGAADNTYITFVSGGSKETQIQRLSASANKIEVTQFTASNALINGATIGATTRGPAYFTTLEANGSVTLGSDTADNITINGDIDSDLIPNVDVTFDLGSIAKKWNNIYADKLFATSSLGRIAIGTGSNDSLIEMGNPTGDKYRGLRFLSGSTEKWFAGVDTINDYVLRTDGSTDRFTFTTNGRLDINQTTNGLNSGIEMYYSTSDWNIYVNSNDDLRFIYNKDLNLGGWLDHTSTAIDSIDFTGQHRNISLNNFNISQSVGLIMVSIGEYKNSDMSNKPTINESLPIVTLSSKRNQKSVWGVLSDSEDLNESSRTYKIGIFVSVFPKTNQDDNRLIINSIGEGGMWVCNINGNLENGDYITTCEIPGHGMKQDDDLLHNYTVAKITQDCTFELNNPNYDCVEFQFSGSTYRKAFVGCTYHCG